MHSAYYLPGTIPNAIYTFTHLIFTTILIGNSVIILILQIRKLSSGTGQSLAHVTQPERNRAGAQPFA